MHQANCPAMGITLHSWFCDLAETFSNKEVQASALMSQNYKGLDRLGFQNVAICVIKGAAKLTGFSCKKMYPWVLLKRLVIITR